MKTFNKLLLGAAVVLATCVSSFADYALTSFNVTNTLNPGDTVVSYPTNSINGTTNIATGNAVDLLNYDKFGINVTGFATSTNANSLTFKLVRANVSGGTPTASSQFENTSVMQISVPIAIGTNVALNYTTNVVDVFYAYAASHIGLSSMTNNCVLSTGGAPNGISNLTVNIVRKKVAVTY